MALPLFAESPGRLRSTIRSVGTSFAVTVVLLLLVELSLRILRPDIHPLGVDRNLIIDTTGRGTARLRPRAAGLADGVGMTVDRNGFWSYTVPADTAKPAWLLLGDSVTMGVGVHPDSSFAGLLAASCRNATILNPSWVGYSSADYCSIAASLLDTAAPGHPFTIRHVTVIWTLNDIYSNLELPEEPGQGVRRTGGDALAWLKTNWRTYQWVKGIIFDRSRAYYEHDCSLYFAEGPYWESAKKDLRTLRDLCCLHDVTLDVVLLPYEYQCRISPDSVAVPQHMLRAELCELGVRTYDVLSGTSFSSLDAKELFRFGDGIHLSARGHRVIFEYVASLLCETQRPE